MQALQTARCSPHADTSPTASVNPPSSNEVAMNSSDVPPNKRQRRDFNPSNRSKYKNHRSNHRPSYPKHRNHGRYHSNIRNHRSYGNRNHSQTCEYCDPPYNKSHTSDECRQYKAYERISKKLGTDKALSVTNYASPYFELLDSGSTLTHVNDLSRLTNISEIDSTPLTLAGGSISSTSCTIGQVGSIPHVHYTPSFNQNLVSIYHLASLGYRVIFEKDMANLVDIATNEICGTAMMKNKLYYMNLSTVRPSTFLKESSHHQSNIASTSPSNQYTRYHNLLAANERIICL
jgi:hypothetical protein